MRAELAANFPTGEGAVALVVELLTLHMGLRANAAGVVP